MDNPIIQKKSCFKTSTHGTTYDLYEFSPDFNCLKLNLHEYLVRLAFFYLFT